jgi:hypothetical protein
MSSDAVAKPASHIEPERRRWRLEPEEIPPELQDNGFLRGCTMITPDEEALLDQLAELDRLDP